MWQVKKNCLFTSRADNIKIEKKRKKCQDYIEHTPFL